MYRSIPLFAAGACGRPFDRADAWRMMGARQGQGRQGRHGGGMGMGFGPPGGFPFGPGRGFQRRSKARRGDVRTAILLLLAEQPRNGYQLMQELESRSEGAWRPSAGSVYPAIQLLEDEGLVRSEDDGGRTLLHLTDEGRRAVEARDPGQPAPWEAMGDDFGDDVKAMWGAFREIAFALTQVTHAGDEAQVAEARRLLAATRRSLYRLLADGTDAEDAPKDAA